MNTKTKTLDPHYVSFDKKYFMNLVGDFKCISYQEAKEKNPRLASICEKLSPADIEYLIDKIENIL